MTAGGHGDEAIQNTLKELGYWGGDDAGTGGSSIVNTQPAIGGDGNINAYNFSTPKFNQQGVASLKEYGPGGTYEMNPAALGFQFDESGKINRPQGGFTDQEWAMSEAFPGVNKSNLTAQYENFNDFLGRGSAYKDARVKGKMGSLIDMIPYMGTIKRVGEGIFGAPGDKSDRA